MKNCLKTFAACAFLTLGFSAAHATSINLLVNGDFSAGVTKVPAGWTAINNRYEGVQAGPSYYLGNGQGDGTTYLSQSFSDTVGNVYDLTFTVYIDNSNQNFFSASVGGTSLFSGTDMTAGIYTETESFIGTGNDTLTFGSYAAGANHLSEVSVTDPPATPEPSSLIFLSTGLFGSVGAAWIKRRKA